MEQVYDDAHTGSNPDKKALTAVMQLYSALPEFQITNRLLNSKSTTAYRDIPDVQVPPSPPPVEGYKAVVYLFLAGAMDSYSALVPDASCYLHNQYLNVRGDVAITSGVRPISAVGSNQPCNSFGLHPSLANIHQLYTDGDASYIANIGPMIVPMDKFDFESQSKPQPTALFAHNTQTQLTQAVFADSSAGGVLGRMGDALNSQEAEDVFSAYSISGTPKVLEGAPGVSKPADVLSGSGVASFNAGVSPYESQIEDMTKTIASSIHGETYSNAMTNTIYRMRLLDGVVGELTLENDGCFNALDTDIASQFQQTARLIKSRDGLEAKRDVFYTQHGGYDTHSDNGATLTERLKEVDDAVGCFVTEMKAQGIWNNVTIVSASEFGRTLTSNGLGTDHAWGANHWVAGGDVKGGQIHGQFPDDLTDNGILNIGRGRLIPTTPWEGLWNSLSEWMGVTGENISSVLPLIGNFPSNIFTASDMFDSGPTSSSLFE